MKRANNKSTPLLSVLSSQILFTVFFFFVLFFSFLSAVAMLINSSKKNNRFIRFTKHLNKYHINIYFANGLHQHFTYKNYKQAAFIYSKLTGSAQSNNQLNLF
jgi:hypothetical protein